MSRSIHHELSGSAENTDRELYRERAGDYYADSIHVTADGGIGMNCGGLVLVRPIRKWHEAAYGWHSVRHEPAPKEEPLIGGYAKGKAAIILGEVWLGPDGAWYEGDCNTKCRSAPTHWKRMPDPPFPDLQDREQE